MANNLLDLFSIASSTTLDLSDKSAGPGLNPNVANRDLSRTPSVVPINGTFDKGNYYLTWKSSTSPFPFSGVNDGAAATTRLTDGKGVTIDGGAGAFANP